MFQSVSTRIRAVVAVFTLCYLFVACGRTTPLREVLGKTPYEQYVQSLKKADLDQTALGTDWLAASEQSLQDSLIITLPFKETGYFAADKPEAWSYRLAAKRGEQLVIRVEVDAPEPTRLFLDVFALTEKPVAVAHATDDSLALTYEVEADDTYLIRLQPELLRSGNYTISITREPTLAFPVSGKDSRNVASFWGVDRDGGKRRHEGIDVFAKRGTPAIAATEGFIRGVNENRLGGKVVWLMDSKRNQSLYYAHLDSQLVRVGQRVAVGDTIGLIGNTGNARTTGPHLHFGIYRFGSGAFDPLPAVRLPSGEPQPVLANADKMGAFVRATPTKLSVRFSPDAKALVRITLPRHTLVKVSGVTGNWYRVVLPDGLAGYVASRSVESLQEPIRHTTVKQSRALLDNPVTNAAILTHLQAGEAISVLATFGDYLYVQTPQGQPGWLPPIHAPAQAAQVKNG